MDQEDIRVSFDEGEVGKPLSECSLAELRDLAEAVSDTLRNLRKRPPQTATSESAGG